MSVIGNAIMVTVGGSGGGEVWAAISVTYPVGSVCTATNGTITLTAADTSGQVVFGIPEPSSTPETWTISCIDNEDSDSTTIDIDEYGQSEYIRLQYSKIYGVSWDGSSTTLWTRTDGAIHFTDPVPYIDGATNYGSPFDTIYPWSDMVIVEDQDAGTMVKIPKFWYKLTQNGNGMSIQIANYAENDFVVCPACMDRGDSKGERDYILVGRYHCANNYKSVTDTSPTYATRNNFRNNIKNLGTNIYQWDFATRFTIWLLYLVEYANWNSQAIIGYGCGNFSSRQNMGYTNSMPYHTGTIKNSRTTYGVSTQYRYIEGLWDNVLDWIDGCYYNSNGFFIIKNPSNFSDNSNGTKIAIPSSGFPNSFSIKNISGTFPMFIPSGAAGSNSTYSCDRWVYTANNACVCSGAFFYQQLERGLFGIDCNTSSYSGGEIGSRVMKLPDFS